MEAGDVRVRGGFMSSWLGLGILIGGKRVFSCKLIIITDRFRDGMAQV